MFGEQVTGRSQSSPFYDRSLTKSFCFNYPWKMISICFLIDVKKLKLHRKSQVQTLFIFFSLGTNDNTSLQIEIFESLFKS